MAKSIQFWMSFLLMFVLIASATRAKADDESVAENQDQEDLGSLMKYFDMEDEEENPSDEGFLYQDVLGLNKDMSELAGLESIAKRRRAYWGGKRSIQKHRELNKKLMSQIIKFKGKSNSKNRKSLKAIRVLRR